MKYSEQRKRAKEFAERWKNRGRENQEDRLYWQDLLKNVFDVDTINEGYLVYQKPVHSTAYNTGKKTTKSIDVYIPSVKVLIEQKELNLDLDKKYVQSDGASLTPYEQAKRYSDDLLTNETANWIIVSNFSEIRIYNLNKHTGSKGLQPVKIALSELPDRFRELEFLVDPAIKETIIEKDLSIEAGKNIARIYDALKAQYGISENDNDKTNQQYIRSLNILCVRLVFLFYADDSDIFNGNQFHDYIAKFSEDEIRTALRDLFKILDTKEENRDKFERSDLNAFPYVNGGLFSDSIEIPQFNKELKDLLLNKASGKNSESFNWRKISPTIFGAIFEATLDPKKRKTSGMHYTSIKNIHKVIDPLFLDNLKQRYNKIITDKSTSQKSKETKLLELQNDLGKIKCFDPACGSGNFLTESYLSLRRLENNILDYLQNHQKALYLGQIQVSIQNFYGIEINDFAVSVAKTALWIAESQMFEETKKILQSYDKNFLPLKTFNNIHEGNALTGNWNNVIAKKDENLYIIGNPPFVGSSKTNEKNSQKYDMDFVFGNIQHGKLDYVASWYWKAAEFIQNTKTTCAFLSTSSITQGEQVSLLWKPLFEKKNIEINFAYQPFKWDSEVKGKAQVECVIIGFSLKDVISKKLLFNEDYPTGKEADHINGYLYNMPDFYIQSRSNNLCGYPKMVQGNKPWDDGNLIFSETEKENFCAKYPNKSYLLHPFYGGKELLHGNKRYCLWLKNIDSSEYIHIPEIITRLNNIEKYRLNSKTEAVQAQAKTPYLFSQIRQPDQDYLAFPEVSNNNRDYIPIAFLTSDDIASNKIYMIPGADMFMFGVLTSKVHMAWLKVVAGRLGEGYSYSPSVYNNFPWPDISDKEKKKISETAEGIIKARKNHPTMNLSQMYSQKTYMPDDLRRAHDENDKAVFKAYGFTRNFKRIKDSTIVEKLMDMYQKILYPLG